MSLGYNVIKNNFPQFSLGRQWGDPRWASPGGPWSELWKQTRAFGTGTVVLEQLEVTDRNQFTTWEMLRHPALAVWGSSNSGYSVILRCCGSMVLKNKNCPQSLLYHGCAPSFPTGSASEKRKADVTLSRAGKLKVVFQQQHQTNLSQKLPRFPHFQVRDKDTSPVTSFESL